MTRQIFASALFAGLAAGAVAFLLQYLFINPLIIEGELYEEGVRVHFAASLDAAVQSPAGLDVSVERDIMRDAQSFGFSLISYVAYALILLAAMALAEQFGHPVAARRGLVWGVAAYFALQLAPAFGLPPELPGMVGAEIGLRQTWWIGTVVATALGIALIAFGPGLVYALAGAVLVMAPHVFGAPHLDTYWGVAPPELSAHFATTSLGVSAISWVVLGYLAAFFWVRHREE